MEENKLVEPKIIAYEYLLNYFGEDTFNDKKVLGASISIAIKPFVDGKEVRFTHEPKCERYYLSDIFNVSFNRDKIFIVKKDDIADSLFRSVNHWDEIIHEVVGYTLDHEGGILPYEKRKDMPEQFQNLHCSIPLNVSEKVFRDFISSNLDEFDIPDNIKAQVPAVSYI